MPEFTEHEPGVFCWFDIATTDAEGAKKFYRSWKRSWSNPNRR